jgi:hypothetical protein
MASRPHPSMSSRKVAHVAAAQLCERTDLCSSLKLCAVTSSALLPLCLCWMAVRVLTKCDSLICRQKDSNAGTAAACLSNKPTVSLLFER